jgi:iron complex outermembrane receptor protein
MSPKRLLQTALLLALLPAWARAQGTGQLSGTVTGPGDNPISGVTVVINEVAMAEITDDNGRYVLTGLPPGKYSVTFSLGDNSQNADVEIQSGSTATLDKKVDWDVSYAETITVYSASRRRERIVEAPAAITIVSEQELEREAAHGQLAKVLEFTPGVELTQSGLYDFNVNTRGFNSSLNRRVPALIDGRDPNVPFLMSTDWPSMSSMGDIASVEMIRGPSSALYGTNAFNGVINMTTKQPRYSQGGTVRLTAGELNTRRGDVRWAGGLSDTNYLKVNGSFTQSDDWYQSRTAATGVEYSRFCTAAEANSPNRNCFQRPEPFPVVRNDDELWQAGLRFDHYIGERFLTLEGGTSHAEGAVIQTGIGRVQILEQDRPWARANFSSEHFNILGYYNKRDAPRQVALASGANLVLDERNWAGEVQGNFGFAASKGLVIAGASYKDEDIDTRNAAGVSTLTQFNPVGTQRKAAYAQLEYSFTPKFKVVAAGRYDDSGLHDAEFSPKLALVFAPSTNQTIRVSYNQAFQSPNYSEFFLAAPAGAPLNLAAAAAANPSTAPLAPALTAFGFNNLVLFARGNNNLDVEKIKTYEAGYSGILGGKTYVTLDYYRSELENFVTDLLPGVNPAFQGYQVPGTLGPAAQAGVTAFLAAVLGANRAGLSSVNGSGSGAPALVFSYTNAGKAETQGIELGINYYVTDQWTVGANYNWFDFEIKSSRVGDQLLPNSPENQASATLAYVSSRFDFNVGYRWVDGFRWAVGPFLGNVDSYDVVDVGANFSVGEHVVLGVNVSNVLDNEHWESFGGDLLGRRALGTVTFDW